MNSPRGKQRHYWWWYGKGEECINCGLKRRPVIKYTKDYRHIWEYYFPPYGWLQLSRTTECQQEPIYNRSKEQT